MTVDEMRSILVPIVSLYPINRVILFGSQARGDATEGSDVDLIIDSGGRLSAFDYFGVIGMIVKKMPIKVDVFELDEIKRPSSMLDSINREGVTIYER